MASHPAPTVPVRPEPRSLRPTLNLQPRPALQREGARIFLSVAEQATEDAMMRPSPPPERVLGKRTRSGDDPSDGSDTEPDVEPYSTTQMKSLSTSYSKVTAVTQRYAMKKLRPEQHSEVQALLSDTELGRQTKLFESNLSSESKANALGLADAQPYQLSQELENNINHYCIAVLLSVNIRAYKGDIPRNHVLDILSEYYFDFPAGVEHNHPNWDQISTFVGDSVSQARTRLKKLIEESIQSNTNIFTLVQMIIHSTPCRPTIQLCTRVALMRAIYAECNGNVWFWNLIDARLDFIRSRAGCSVSQTAKAFQAILEADCVQYGTDKDYANADVIASDWQHSVDGVVARRMETV